jgi:hypothetical protein
VAHGLVTVPRHITKTIALRGDIFRLAYAPAANRAYGLDAKARSIASIDLSSGDTSYASVVQVPDAACVDDKRSRLVVVNQGSSLISEYALADMKLAREFTWSGLNAKPASSHFGIHCAGDKLYLVDAAMNPGLFVVEDLAADPPKVVDRSAQIAGVSSLVFKADHSEFYAAFSGASGVTKGPLRRYAAGDLSTLDQLPLPASNDPFTLGTLAVPLLLDEQRNLLIAKTTVFDALNLSKRVYTLPSYGNSLSLRESEYVQALDSRRGWVATRRSVFELERFERVSPTASSSADQMFFDRDGQLWHLNTAKRTLRAQSISTN